MQKILLCLLLALHSRNSCPALPTEPVDTIPLASIINRLATIQLDSFRGKPIDSFLANIPAGVYHQQLNNGLSNLNPAYKPNLDIHFTADKSGPFARIWVEDLSCINTGSSTPDQDIALFRQGNIWRINIYDDHHNCINGDCLPVDLPKRTDTLAIPQLIPFMRDLQISNYYNKPVDSFLLAIPANMYGLKVYGGDHSQGAMFKASFLYVDFTPDRSGPCALIYVREYTHMDRFSPTATWDVNLFRKEKIYRIDVYKDQNTCINGECLQ